MKRSRSIRLEDEDEALFERAAKATEEESVSAWVRRTLRREAKRDIARVEKGKSK